MSEVKPSDDRAPEIRPIRDEQEWEAALAVRRQVFVVEQFGPLDEEPDAWDASARQFAVLDGSVVVGTARLYQPAPGVGQIGRLALLKPYRSRGWGGLLLAAVTHHARDLGVARLRLNAQSGAIPFYRRHGFTPVGEEFMEAGIPHQSMTLELVGD